MKDKFAIRRPSRIEVLTYICTWALLGSVIETAASECRGCLQTRSGQSDAPTGFVHRVAGGVSADIAAQDGGTEEPLTLAAVKHQFSAFRLLKQPEVHTTQANSWHLERALSGYDGETCGGIWIHHTLLTLFSGKSTPSDEIIR
eukprot:623422-Prorocentrum_minimum.AAC.2